MGLITRVAGTGTAGGSGDEGPATEAELSNPFAVAATADGGFLITDTGNDEVRKVSAAGVITRLRGLAPRGTAGTTARPPTPNSAIHSEWRPLPTAGS